MNNFKLIVAKTKNNFISDENGELIFRIPNDLKHFKAITTNQVVIMGRKTFESIGKPLPNRINIVITRNLNFLSDDTDDNIIIINSYYNLFEYLKFNHTDKNKFIIGGGEIYKFFIENNKVNEYYITDINADYLGKGIRFPYFSLDNFNKSVILEGNHNDIEYHILKYVKK